MEILPHAIYYKLKIYAKRFSYYSKKYGMEEIEFCFQIENLCEIFISHRKLKI